MYASPSVLEMLGGKKDMGFDGFLSEMGKWELEQEEKGLNLRAVICGAGDKARDYKTSISTRSN